MTAHLLVKERVRKRMSDRQLPMYALIKKVQLMAIIMKNKGFVFNCGVRYKQGSITTQKAFNILVQVLFVYSHIKKEFAYIFPQVATT